MKISHCRPIAATATALVVAATALAGCGGSGNSTKSTSKTPSTSKTTSGANSGGGGGGVSAIQGSATFNDANLNKLAKEIQGKIGSKSLSAVKIAMVTNGNSAYWNEAEAGWNAAMKWLKPKGASGEFQEPSSSTPSAQVSLLQTLTSQGYSWGLSAVTSAAATEPIAQAVGKGLHVIAFDSELPNTKAQFFIGTPNTEAGCQAGKAMKAAIGSGDVVAISGSLTATNTEQRLAGFKQCAGSGIKVVQTLNDNQDVNTATSDIQSALQANSSIKGVYAIYSYDGGAAVQGVLGAGDKGKVTVVSDDGESDTIADVSSGAIAASILQRPYYQGYMLAYTLAADEILGVKATDALVKPYFDSPGVLSTGVGVMTKANIGTFKAFWRSIGLTSQ